MSKNAIEKRKEKDSKPKLLFSLQCNVWDDGIISAKLIENSQYGRERVKVIHPSGNDFLAAIRSVVPAATDKVTPLVKAIDGDAGTTEVKESERVGIIKVDIYSNGFIDADFFELIHGANGRPKAWRRFYNEFADAMKNIGDAIEPLKQLGSGGVIDAKSEDE